MKKYLIIFLLFIFANAHGGVGIRLELDYSEVKQGELLDATLYLPSETIQKINVQKLNGQTLGETIYLYQIAPLMRKDGQNTFEAHAKVVFIKVPENNPVFHKLGDIDIKIEWSKIKVIKTDVPPELIFDYFEIPERANYIKWLIGALSGFVVLVCFFIFRKRYKLSKEKRAKKMAIKNRVLSVNNYSQVVALWQEKHQIQLVFPHLTDPFKDFELVLFKYQFKPSQTESEQQEVMTAYKDFILKIQGGFDGV